MVNHVPDTKGVARSERNNIISVVIGFFYIFKYLNKN